MCLSITLHDCHMIYTDLTILKTPYILASLNLIWLNQLPLSKDLSNIANKDLQTAYTLFTPMEIALIQGAPSGPYSMSMTVIEGPSKQLSSLSLVLSISF